MIRLSPSPLYFDGSGESFFLSFFTPQYLHFTIEFPMTSSENKQVPTPCALQHKQANELRIAICYAEWNSDITHLLRDGAIATLREAGLLETQISLLSVPGAFELTYAAASCLESPAFYDAVIIIGCVIRGETSHYDCICNAVTQGITTLNLHADKPVIFGLITTENKQQALDRSGGKLGNKGCEAAIAALQMIDFSCELEKLSLSLHPQREDNSAFIK